jgi:predicted DNA-binding transcriptional regulator AlpA
MYQTKNALKEPETVSESLVPYRRESLLNVLKDPEAALYIGMSESFLRQSRMDGIRENRTPGPPFVKIGRAVRYLIEDLDAWLEKYRQLPAGGGEDDQRR